MGRREAHRLRLAAAAIAACLVCAGAALAAAGSTVTVSDGNDTPVLLDIKQASLAQPGTARLLARVSTYESWQTAYLLAPEGPPGSICLDLWTKRTPGSESPDFLVCVTARSNGRLTASVLRERSGPPAKVATASVSRPNTRTVAISFTPSSIGSPKRLRFAAEATQALGCPRPRGCFDRAPNGAGSRTFLLRS